MSKIKDYLKCVYVNKATFAGYICGVVFLGGIVYTNLSSNKKIDKEEFSASKLVFVLAGVGSYLGLGLTLAGRDTFKTYKRTKEHLLQYPLSKYQTIDSRFVKKYSNNYCNEAGLTLALKEHSLEYELQNTNSRLSD
jgi:hypothetical protein